MLNMDKKLLKREEEGKVIRVGHQQEQDRLGRGMVNPDGSYERYYTGNRI